MKKTIAFNIGNDSDDVYDEISSAPNAEKVLLFNSAAFAQRRRQPQTPVQTTHLSPISNHTYTTMLADTRDPNSRLPLTPQQFAELGVGLNDSRGTIYEQVSPNVSNIGEVSLSDITVLDYRRYPTDDLPSIPHSDNDATYERIFTLSDLGLGSSSESKHPL